MPSKRRFNNIDVTLHPQNVSKVHSIILCKHDVLLHTLLPMFMELYATVCEKSLEEVMQTFQEHTIQNTLEQKAWLSQFGEVTILPDEDSPPESPLS